MSRNLGTKAILEDTVMASQTNPRPNDQEGSRTPRVMAHLRDSIFSHLKKLDPSLSPDAGHSSLIESRLGDLFPAFHTPTHPPYALVSLPFLFLFCFSYLGFRIRNAVHVRYYVCVWCFLCR